MITKDDLKDEDNLAQCECGDWAHREHVSDCPDGASSCPACQIEWMANQIELYKNLMYELADPALSKKDITTRVHKGMADIMCCDLDYYIENYVDEEEEN